MADVQTGPYPIAENVLLLARAIVNDMLRQAGGAILVDTAPFTIVFLNAAIRKTQRYLANNGLFSQIVDNFVLTPLTPVANSDPGTQIFVGYNGYNNGQTTAATPALPPDLVLPLNVFQRQTGSGAQFVEVWPAKSALMSRIPGPYFGEWEWRGDAIRMVGCTNTMDLRIRYEQSVARLSPGTNLQTATIPIIDGEDALGFGLVTYYSFSRGSAQRQEANAAWLDACDQLINRYVRKDQRIAVRPKGYAAGGGTIDGALSGDYR
jgi:hypothetical protein